MITSERRIWIDAFVHTSGLKSDGRKIYLDRRSDTATRPVTLALKHLPTLPKEYPLETDDLEQEEQPQQHELNLHTDRMTP